MLRSFQLRERRTPLTKSTTEEMAGLALFSEHLLIGFSASHPARQQLQDPSAGAAGTIRSRYSSEIRSAH